MDINQIYLGDAYKLIKQVPDKSVSIIATDPPYNLTQNGFGKTADGKWYSRPYAKEIAEETLANGIDLSIMNEFVRIMKKVNIYIWCNKEQIYDYMTFFVKERKCNFEILIWAKGNPAPFLNGHYLKDKEYCLYFWESGVKLKPTYETGKTVYVSNANMDDKKAYNHPTIKPENIIENLIRNSCVEGGLVFDPFVGSGTSCVVAKRLGYDYLGFEINPKWHAVAVDRLNGITQKERKAGVEQLKLF